MRIAVMGAGGIGAYLGGMLSRSGVDTTLVCRGAHLAVIQRQGLKILTHEKTLVMKNIRATSDPRTAGVQDVVIQAVKMYDLESSSRQMLPMIGPATMVVPIQNGVVAPAVIGAIAGTEHVVGGLVFISAHIEEPGVVRLRSRMNPLVFGELDGSLSERVLSFQKQCLQAGIEARASDNIVRDQWRKLVPVAGLSAMSSLTRLPVGPILDTPPLRALYAQGMGEVAKVAAAKQVFLGEDIVERMLALATQYDPNAKVSMLEDLEAGKPLELEWLSGYISHEGARAGVATPFHDAAYACLKWISRKRS